MREDDIVEMGYYRPDLAAIHDAGFGEYADLCAPGLLGLLSPVLVKGGTVVELGCGSGALSRHLIGAGHHVIATDGSPAMVELAGRRLGVDVHKLELPDDPIPTADAIVSVGHVINYLSSSEEARRGLTRAAQALRPDGVLAVDVCDMAFGAARPATTTNATVRDDWVIVTTGSLPAPDRYTRHMTTFVATEEGGWRRDDETHNNVLLDTAQIPGWFDSQRFDAELRQSFGIETLPEGLVVLVVRRRG